MNSFVASLLVLRFFVFSFYFDFLCVFLSYYGAINIDRE